MPDVKTVNAQRTRNWYKNAFHYQVACHFSSGRDEQLWVFSAWEGRKYSDNARYLFEYILNNHPEVRCIWQTQNKALYGEMKEKSIPVQLIGTEESRKTLRQAGVAVFTNGIDDFGFEGDVFGAVLVCLWHGFGLKQGYRQLYKQKNPLKRFISNTKWDIFSWVKRDISIVVSEYTKRQYAQMFRIKNTDDILIAGQARYDAFSKQLKPQDVFSSEKIIDRIRGKRIVLYMPTFRNDTDKMVSMMDELSKSEAIYEILQQANAILIHKLHYLNRGNLQSTASSIFLNDDEVVDTQLLLATADLLITDYSSCAIDYSLLERPELFFFPDWEEKKKGNEIIPEIDEICSVNHANTIDELCNALRMTLNNPSIGIQQCEKVREYFCDPTIPIGSYAENNYKLIVQRLRERRIHRDKSDIL